jgi:hypothetical protein
MKFMKINNFLKVMMAAVAIVIGVSSCDSDDDDSAVAVADEVVGSYTGEQVITIMGDPEDDTATFKFVKSSDSSIDMIIPQSGEGMMVIPALTVKNIPLKKYNNGASGTLDSFTGTVINAKGEEKTFTVSKLMVVFDTNPKGKAVVATYVLKYGSMPFEMVTTFNGSKDK